MNRDGICGETEKRPERTAEGMVNVVWVCERPTGHLGQHMTHGYGYWNKTAD